MTELAEEVEKKPKREAKPFTLDDEKECPRCKDSGTIGALFGTRQQYDKSRPQSYCKRCRANYVKGEA